MSRPYDQYQPDCDRCVHPGYTTSLSRTRRHPNLDYKWKVCRLSV